jgi:hypothetical protein
VDKVLEKTYNYVDNKKVKIPFDFTSDVSTMKPFLIQDESIYNTLFIYTITPTIDDHHTAATPYFEIDAGNSDTTTYALDSYDKLSVLHRNE